jgi:hypothetical protein
MPVYKEGLKGVIIPTVTSLLAAVKFYEEQGGTASIFVNDDGMRLVQDDMQEARKAFYELNHIGWCSRPAQNTDKDSPDFFIRKGQFKKASNMNYCLDFSIRVEDEMQRLIDATCQQRGCTQDDLTIQEEEDLYDEARTNMVEKDAGKTWAAGNIRMGEVILIIDSDTRVPEDCLLYGALEMIESPEVALLQHASGILQVVNNVFENGITYFTNLIYTSIQFAVGNGDCAPFVGHNTFIRWKAIQSIAFQDEEGNTKFWSEDHVSEDFDVSLRLQMNDFVVRLATYHNGGFKEGVSLTVYDELARWEKYAYGCNELVFNPFYKWPYKGPFTRLFLRFLFSKIKVTSKITILAYIGTYYAIASAIPLTLANYLIVGWFTDEVDQFYITSWKIFVGMAVVFNILSPLAYAMLRHRLGQATFFKSCLETAKWTPMFLLFFGGISYHLLKALICHFFSIKMEWTTTAKELSESGFRVGLDRIVRDFKFMYMFIMPIVGGMIYLAIYAPRGWLIADFAAIVPLANQIGCHALLPVSLPHSSSLPSLFILLTFILSSPSVSSKPSSSSSPVSSVYLLFNTPPRAATPHSLRVALDLCASRYDFRRTTGVFGIKEQQPGLGRTTGIYGIYQFKISFRNQGNILLFSLGFPKSRAVWMFDIARVFVRSADSSLRFLFFIVIEGGGGLRRVCGGKQKFEIEERRVGPSSGQLRARFCRLWKAVEGGFVFTNSWSAWP